MTSAKKPSPTLLSMWEKFLYKSKKIIPPESKHRKKRASPSNLKVVRGKEPNVWYVTYEGNIVKTLPTRSKARLWKRENAFDYELEIPEAA